MFGASQLRGKVGRAFLRVISERQYARVAVGDRFGLDPPLREALNQWLKLVRAGPPENDGLLSRQESGRNVVHRWFFTGFSFIGLPKKLIKSWLERKTQIVPVEMLAPVVALETFADRLLRADLFLFTDSEVVEAALVKGYSSREDLCTLVSVFWDLIMRLQVRVFIARVATDANPADAPSRDDLETGSKAGWLTVEAAWPEQLVRD